jgi:hypothetical protein
MSMPSPTEGRATLARSYRNLSEREIRARLEGSMSDVERVTAQAELLRRNASDNGPDTTLLASGFAPTSAFETEGAETAKMPFDDGLGVARRSTWPWVVLLVGGTLAALGWAVHARLLHLHLG